MLSGSSRVDFTEHGLFIATPATVGIADNSKGRGRGAKGDAALKDPIVAVFLDNCDGLFDQGLLQISCPPQGETPNGWPRQHPSDVSCATPIPDDMS